MGERDFVVKGTIEIFLLTNKMTPANSDIQIQNLDHLGLVAGIIDELRIVEIVGSPMVILGINDQI